MGIRYVPSRNTFMTLGPEHIVPEDNVGRGNAELEFPGVSSCTGVGVIATDGFMVGMHLTVSSEAPWVDAMAAKLGEFLQGRTVAALVLFGVLDAAPGNNSWKRQPRFAWAPPEAPRQIDTLRAMLGATGAPVHALSQHGKGANFDYQLKSAGGGAFELWIRPAGQQTTPAWTRTRAVKLRG